MSNFQQVDLLKQGRKVIGLKPINQKSLLQNTEDAEKNEVSIEEKIKQADLMLENAKLQSEKLIKQTEAQIKKDKERWQQEKEELVKQAHDKGYQNGFQQGERESRQMYQELIDQGKTIIDSAKAEYEAIVNRSEEVILHLSMKAAEKILHVELDQHDYYLMLIREVLADSRGQSRIEIYSHPEDYRLILTQQEELLQLVPAQTEVYFYPDTKLTSGACIVETPFGKIDAGVDSQLYEIKKKLLETYQEQANER